MDLWILSRLSAAVEACNTGFKSYNFQGITKECYSLWINDLCDVYLVSVTVMLAMIRISHVLFAERRKNVIPGLQPLLKTREVVIEFRIVEKLSNLKKKNGFGKNRRCFRTR